ncbi:MAG TPA: DsbA family oxidoreductase [Jatrophihabitans sp.]|nr:DsbA family oxidoreductase [Jatrophihabitans sp.]
MQVEIWSDVVCPWCYLGKRRFEEALAGFEHGDEVVVRYRSFELDPSAPAGETVPTVQVLADRYGMSPAQAEDAQRQMEQRAAADGLTFRMAGLQSGNTRTAHRLLQYAADEQLQPELVERLHRAYFSEGRSVFDPDSLVELAGEAGLDHAGAARVVRGTDYDSAVTADEEQARALGATGVPFFVVDRRYAISGAQPAELIRQALDRAWQDAAG